MASTIQLYNATAEDKYYLTADPISMMKKAGLDWTVSTLPIVACGTDGAAYSGGDYRAIVREDTGFVFAVAKEGYTSIQNHELADLCYEITSFSGTSCTQVGSINNGKRVFFQVDLGQVNIGGDPRDVVNNNFFIGTSHDTSWATTLGLNAQRIVCMNTFMMALAGMKGKADSASMALSKVTSVVCSDTMTAVLTQAGECVMFGVGKFVNGDQHDILEPLSVRTAGVLLFRVRYFSLVLYFDPPLLQVTMLGKRVGRVACGSSFRFLRRRRALPCLVQPRSCLWQRRPVRPHVVV